MWAVKNAFLLFTKDKECVIISMGKYLNFK